jgi:quinol monooxygenase YgiN
MLTPFGSKVRWLPLGLLAVILLAPSRATGEEKEDPILAFVKKQVKDPAKPFTLVVSLKVKEGTGDKFEAAFAKALTATRKEKGCLTYDLNRDSQDALSYVVYERWKSVADLEAHLKSDHIKTLLKVLPDVAAGAPDLRVLTPASE